MEDGGRGARPESMQHSVFSSLLIFFSNPFFHRLVVPLATALLCFRNGKTFFHLASTFFRLRLDRYYRLNLLLFETVYMASTMVVRWCWKMERKKNSLSKL